ncbi:MAG: hypothetical protein A2736_02735 [Candidatus Yanofskybacteria bacterium RIFCSPHIGHO2_01_FULL_41_27]|uniref:Uncharacterized protein n=3 Tax=Candidatus Yanofskyibacteriota TaxID=1752733 RepID=A0A1F8HUF9_9BACT|nr:MAG: hypothetical protein UU84_C0032G0006 [Candidatus Yanofskybacteria bacterium GW2011_GWC2_41_9]OGM98798.1 MAG: hypothetical protein A2736_02735 [Candidatus Yanofskybacteria bacterium RIFCSPHIGHO2_01_FULL_41_27]OGN08891.1 MAG: hypothetical protein A3C64_02425 [Candidatus Yanofskybacteria bacterium RIFCSPHIGHO2_02_FULL_41_12]OGN20784.1 MAG: hypothetical protein A3B00_01840 [Candidatus Yanofskybacteria bacterium RIFCSPLOWO2_01_FULL_41_33]OGN41213.1 MAG: hypothetical protein A2606_02400 [Cand
MAELTKEYLDKQLGKLATKSSINNLDKKIDNLAHSVDKKIDNLAHSVDEKIDNLAHSVDEKIDNLAMIVANGFAEVKRELDVRDEVAALNRRMSRIEQALNLKN